LSPLGKNDDGLVRAVGEGDGGGVAVDAFLDLRTVSQTTDLGQGRHLAEITELSLASNEFDLDFLHLYLLEGGVMDRLLREDAVLDVGQVPNEDMTTLFAFHFALIGLDFSGHEEGSAHRAFWTVEGVFIIAIIPGVQHSAPPCS